MQKNIKILEVEYIEGFGYKVVCPYCQNVNQEPILEFGSNNHLIKVKCIKCNNYFGVTLIKAISTLMGQ